MLALTPTNAVDINSSVEGLSITMLGEGIMSLEEGVEEEVVVVVALPSGRKKNTRPLVAVEVVVEVAVAIVVALTLPEDTVLPLVVGMEIPLMQGSLISLLEREELLVEVVAAVAVVAAAEVDVEAIIMMYSTLLDTVELAVV
jgi:hypothetical protein